jgi:hypothetical protein
VLCRLDRLADRAWKAHLSLALLAASLTLPMWLNGYLTGHDYSYHLKWAHQFSGQFWSGELYPRWLADMNAGEGSPTFFFYGPLEFWITAWLPPWTGNTLEETAHQVGLSAFMAVFVSGVTFFEWTRRHVMPLPALLAAIVYLLLPYHVLIDVHTRFAFAEFWTFAWMPLVLLFTDRIVRGQSYGVAGLAASYAMMLMTHLPITLMFTNIAVAYLATMASSGSRLRALARGAVAYGWGALLAAIYVLPAMMMQDRVEMPAVLWADGYDAWTNFLFYGQRLHELKTQDFWILLTEIVLFTGTVGIIGAALAWHRDCRRRLIFWGAILLLALFMTHPWSSFLWRLTPCLHVLQFPWRFNVASTLAAAALCGFGAQSVFDEAPSLERVVPLILVGTSLLMPWGLHASELAQNLYHPFHPDADLIVNSADPEEYRPLAVPGSEWAKLWQGRIDLANTHLIGTGTGEATVTVLSRTPRSIDVLVDARDGVVLTVRQFDFAGWQAMLDFSEQIAITATPNGWISLRVPEGSHRLQVRLTVLWPETLGRYLSVLAVCILLAHLAWPKRRPRLAAVANQETLNPSNEAPISKLEFGKWPI